MVKLIKFNKKKRKNFKWPSSVDYSNLFIFSWN